jgi:hypothetical protein
MMNRNILFLVIVAIALAVVRAPGMMLTLGASLGLAIAAIRLFWSMLEAFSKPSATSPSCSESYSEATLSPPAQSRAFRRRAA